MDNTNNTKGLFIPPPGAVASYYALLDEEPIKPEEYALWVQAVNGPVGEVGINAVNIQRFVLELRGIRLEDYLRAYPIRRVAP